MHYNVLFLVGTGIGNVIESLYAVEYCLRRADTKTGVYLHNLSASFSSYLKDCYGDAILDNLDQVTCEHLVHSFCVEDKLDIPFKHYHYVKPDYHSSNYLSETEQYISVVKSILHTDEEVPDTLMLKSSDSEKVNKLALDGKTVLCPGGSSANPVKRWPHFNALIQVLGEENCLVIGGDDDLVHHNSYRYGKLATSLLPQALMNRKAVWTLAKNIGMMQKHAHLKRTSNGYFNEFSWPELVSIFKKSAYVVGNDGGLMHLAAAAGSPGLVIYGPTSVQKNKAYSHRIDHMAGEYPCRPCQFGVGGVQMVNHYISCPFQVKCLEQISVNDVVDKMKEAMQQPMSN